MGEMTSWWRAKAAPIVARVLAETAGKPEPEIRAALRAAYPFGVRRHHPYRIWCDEIRVQRGRRKMTRQARRQQGRGPEPPDERQGELFSEEVTC